MKHGFLLINKPIGPTSHDVVQMVRKALHERSVGHLGTLDPAAEGLLVLAVGKKALKCVELFNETKKEYEAQVTFGAVSSTYDREGVIEETDLKLGWTVPEHIPVRRVIEDKFIGKVSQVPPEASAVKIGGERAYRKFRQGRGVNVPPREIEIEKCEILSYEYPDMTLRVLCSSGTYIRSLANDLGQALHCGGYLASLKRLAVSDWRLEDAVDPKKAAWGQVIPLKEILKDMPRLELNDEDAEHIRNGRDIPINYPSLREGIEGRGNQKNIIGWADGLPIAILEPKKDGSQQIHARKVL